MPLFRSSTRVLLTALVLVLSSPATPKEITIFYTNDIESVYEPVDAFWLDEVEEIGGLAKLATLIENQRNQVPLSFLLDAGDLFTGSLSKATRGDWFLTSIVKLALMQSIWVIMSLNMAGRSCAR